MSSIMKTLIVTCILVIQIPVVGLLIFNYINKKRCMNYGEMTEGRAYSVKSDRYLTVEYEVDGKVFKKKYLKKHYYGTGTKENMQVKYLVAHPSFSFPKTYQIYSLSPDYDLFALLFLFAANILLAVGLFADRETFDFLFNIFILFAILTAAFAMYIAEFRLIRSNKKISGIVTNIGKEKNLQIFVAEYKIDGEKYYTREMKVPSTGNYSALKVGEEVEVKYILNRPHIAIISEDIYEYKNSKTFLFLALAVAIVISFVYILH